MRPIMSTGIGTDPSRGRDRQRMRTRRAVLRAAQELIVAGRTPTVAEAADAAEVSRATAYRYFPSQDALLTEAALHGSSLPTAEDLFGDPDAPTEVEDRVVLVHNVMYDHISARENQFRLFLRARLLQTFQDDPEARSVRAGFRITLLDAALAPLTDELPREEHERLLNALSVLIGTEALIAARDVLQLDHPAARSQFGWACRALVRAARTERTGHGATRTANSPPHP